MFELLSTGQELDFNEYSKETQYLKHLINYQLIRKVCDNSGYTPNIPVIAQRVAHESRSKDNRGLIYPIIDSNFRQPWLIRRIDEISNDFSVLQKIVSTGKTISLFGSNSFPEGVELKSTSVVSNKQTFLSFINTVNRCFVESIERYGKDISKKEYFWSDIKGEYPYLWPALHRIKVYRNEADHLHLKINVTQDYIKYLNEDFEGKNFSQIEEPYFVLQQRILDRLLLALQKEISSKS